MTKEEQKRLYWTIGGLVVIALIVWAIGKLRGQKTTGYTPVSYENYEGRSYGDNVSNPLQELYIDLSKPRNDSEITVSTQGFVVMDIVGEAYVKLNSRNAPMINLRDVKRITMPIEQLYITNEAQEGCYARLLLIPTNTDIAVDSNLSLSESNDIFESYEVKTVEVTSSPVTYMFSKTEFTKCVSVYNLDDAIEIAFVTKDGVGDYMSVAPYRSFTSIPLRAKGFSVRLADDSTTGNVEVRAWY